MTTKTTQARFVDATPTWEGIMPALVHMIQSRPDASLYYEDDVIPIEDKRLIDAADKAEMELMRLARAMDEANLNREG